MDPGEERLPDHLPSCSKTGAPEPTSRRHVSSLLKGPCAHEVYGGLAAQHLAAGPAAISRAVRFSAGPESLPSR